MATEDLNHRLLDVLKELVEHHSSSRCVAEQMGQAHNYVARILRGETKLRLDVLERILDAVGIPASFFFERVIGAARDDDAAQLLRFFGGDGPEPGPFLSDVDRVIEVLLSMPLAEAASGVEQEAAETAAVGEYVSRRERLEDLERSRHADAAAAQASLESLVFDLLADPPVPVPTELLEDLALGLATWSSIQRQRGSRREASEGLAMAFESGRRSRSSHALATVYMKASYVLRDVGQLEVSLRFLERSAERFLHAGDIVSCGKVFNTRGNLRYYGGDFVDAQSDFEAALRLTPKSDHAGQVCAWVGLANCHEKQGRVAQAFDAIRTAQSFYGEEEDASLAFVVWTRAKLAGRMHETLAAEEGLRRAMDLLEHHTEPANVALCALDLASLYCQQGEVAKVRALADRVLAWLPALKGNRMIDSVMMEWVRCAKWGEMTHQMIAEARVRLQQAEA